jgi:enoyl-[acyl-carrier-protein] reductase (NADH)
MARQFAADAPLATSPEGQRIAAGELAVSFIVARMFQHTTGERIHVDGGWATLAKSALPPGNRFDLGATT